jgi:hypothetical protein
VKSFAQAYIDGEAEVKDIYKWIDRWELGVKGPTLMTFIGLEWPEPYKRWLKHPDELSEIMEQIMEKEKGIPVETLDKLEAKGRYSGWDRSDAAKLVLRLIGEIRRLRASSIL